MATLDELKQAIRAATATPELLSTGLSDAQYNTGFDILSRGSQATYQEFIVPQLSQLVTQITDSNGHISVLEIGPGPNSIVAAIPEHLRRKVRRYYAHEPNEISASALQDILDKDCPFPCLEASPIVQLLPFSLDSKPQHTIQNSQCGVENFDLVLFCHSMYGMENNRAVIRQALSLLANDKAMVVIFHRESLNLGEPGLAAHQTASFPTGTVRVPVADQGALESFAAFIAGYQMADHVDEATVQKICRNLGRQDRDHLVFSCPEIMIAFTKHSDALPRWPFNLPVISAVTVKNRQASAHQPAMVVQPMHLEHVQSCVIWAIKHGVGLAILGGGHSGHCLISNVITVDMGAFSGLGVVTEGQDTPVIVAGAGCKTGDIIKEALQKNLTVPLGARPSVGAGLWLQGGIGHLARVHGLSCDAIAGAVVVSLEDGQVLVVGAVPKEHIPTEAVRPENEADLLWAIKGAGTNFCIVVTVALKACPAERHLVRNWVHRVDEFGLKQFDDLVSDEKVPRTLSFDAFLYVEEGHLHLGTTMFKTVTDEPETADEARELTLARNVLGTHEDVRLVNAVGLFDAEMYMSAMHGGHGGGKTSAFKRCLFLKDIGTLSDVFAFLSENRPTDLCYFHFLHGGAAVRGVFPHATAFGCRDWDFACVITGVWPRDQDGTATARDCIDWVYKVVDALLPLTLCTGVYGADLGPDPRDIPLAAKAFGPNLSRLVRLKRTFDPHNILRYACSLPKAPPEPKLIILVTGQSGAGKDYCADVWVSTLKAQNYTAQKLSISEALKRQYAEATNSDLFRLLLNREYKEQHRTKLTQFFQTQVQQDPKLPEKHFLDLVYSAGPIDALFITGMRDEAPVATCSPLVPNSRVIEVRITASKKTRLSRGASSTEHDTTTYPSSSSSSWTGWAPTFTFTNETQYPLTASTFFTSTLLPLLSPQITNLYSLVRPVESFPRKGITFQHILGIAQHPGGLRQCTHLLATLIQPESWGKVSTIVSCEAGGFIFASALAFHLDKPMGIVRKSRGQKGSTNAATTKLPPPVATVTREAGEEGKSHISGCNLDFEGGDGGVGKQAGQEELEERLEMDRDVVVVGGKVVVVDDVLATGRTLCAVLGLLINKVGVKVEEVQVLVVGEFPVHRGREMLRVKGFGRVRVGSLMVFDGK